jgi:CRISPR-associated exonuclease Cas4
MEHTSELVAEGKFIHETSYPQRPEKYQEIEIGGIKIDYYDANRKIVHEIKKSDKVEDAHTWQLKYYLYVLHEHGIHGAKGILEYPKLRIKTEINLTEEDITYLQTVKTNIQTIIESNKCPARIKKTLCKSCSYYDFCWIDESEV